MIDLGVLSDGSISARSSAALGLSNEGIVTGSAAFGTDFNSTSHAFVYDHGQMTDLGKLGAGTVSSAARAANSFGDIVGTGNLSRTSGSSAFIYSGGAFTDLAPLVGLESVGSGINDAGQVIGTRRYGANSNEFHGFIYSNGSFVELPSLGGRFSEADAINRHGVVVGLTTSASTTLDEPYRAFVYRSGQMTRLPDLGGTFAIATGINDSGQIVGFATPPPGSNHALLWNDGADAPIDLGTLGGNFANAVGINNKGQIIGTSPIAVGGVQHPFLYEGGRMIDLNTLIPPNSEWELSSVAAINDAGQIIGRGSFGGTTHAVLLDVPEPTFLAPIVVAAVPAFRRRRRAGASV